VDVHTEQEIEEALSSVLGGVTALLVAHRPSTLALADRVALLAGGRIVESGTHSELLGRSSLYRSLLGGALQGPREDSGRDLVARPGGQTRSG
jgi:ATP-binding cassette subfamily B protein